MLSALRKRSGGIVVKSLLILLIISFGAWGIQDWLSPAISGNAVVTVGDQEIGPYEINRQVNQEMNRLRPLFGDQFTLQQAMGFGIVDGVINDQANQALISQGAASLGVTISDNLISQDIRNQPGFKGLAGNFDRNQFNQILASNGLTENDYINIVRRSLTAEQYAGSFQAGTRAPNVLVDAVYKYRNEKRVVERAEVLSAAFTDVGEPTSSEVEAFHKDNAQMFTAPQYRKFSFLRLESEELAQEIAVSDDEIESAYEARKDEFITPELRHILQMVLIDEDKAKTAHKQLMEGRDFAAVAKEVAGLDEAVLDLGTISRGDLLPELADPAFSILQGSVTEPLKSSLGWHLLKAVSVEPGGTKSLDDVREQVRMEIAREKAVDGLFELSNQLEDELGGGASLEEAAQRLDLDVVSVEAMDTAGTDPTGNPVAGIPAGRAFMQTVFSTESGQESPLTESGPEGFFLVRVDSITAPALRPLESVREQVIEAWKADKRQTKAKELAEQLVAELNSGKALSDVASANGLTPEQSKPFTRDDQGTESGLSEELVSQVFALMPGKAAYGQSANGFQIAVLRSVTPADTMANKKDVDGLRDTLTDALKSDVMAQLTSALREEIGVEVNRALLNQMFSPDPQSAN